MRLIGRDGLIIMAIIPALLSSGCFDRHNHSPEFSDEITGSEHMDSQQRYLTDFQGIEITNTANVYVTQDAQQSVVVEANDNVIDRVNTIVRNGILEVGMESGSYQNVTVNVYVHMKTIQSLDISGSGNISSRSSITSDNLLCVINGAGTIALDSGGVINYTCSIIGAGTIQTFGLTSENCTASISGTGQIEVNATKNLSAHIDGTGSIFYQGNPNSIQQSVSGVGTIAPR